MTARCATCSRGHRGTLRGRRHHGVLQRPGHRAEPGRARAPHGRGRSHRTPDLSTIWRRRGHDIGVGLGIAQGYATIGAIGFEGRWDYGAIGSVANLAARLSAEAKAGQILASTRVADAVEGVVETAPIEPLTLKGFHRPMPAVDVLGLVQAGQRSES